MLSIGTASILSLWPLITTFLRHHALSRSSRYYVSISLFVTASTTALCTLLLPQLCRSYDPNATAYIISLWSLSLQHILCHYASIDTASITSIRSLAWHKIYVTKISIATAYTTLLWPLLVQHLQCHSDLYWPSSSYTTMTLSFQHLSRHYALYCYSSYAVPMILMLQHI